MDVTGVVIKDVKAVRVAVIPIVQFHAIEHVERLVLTIAIKVAREEMNLIENRLLSVYKYG